MNFLELAKRTRLELGVAGDGPVSVQNQQGHMEKIVAWVREAWQEVQQSPALQRTLWDSAVMPLTAGVQTYDPANDWGLPFASVVPDGLYVRRAAQPGNRWLLRHTDWRRLRNLGLGVRGSPQAFAVSPSNKLVLWPVPADGFELDMEYQRTPRELEDNLDEPAMPPAWHMAIVWRAVMFGCAHDENLPLFQSAQANYRAIMNRIGRDGLPELQVAGALA